MVRLLLCPRERDYVISVASFKTIARNSFCLLLSGPFDVAVLLLFCDLDSSSYRRAVDVYVYARWQGLPWFFHILRFLLVFAYIMRYGVPWLFTPHERGPVALRYGVPWLFFPCRGYSFLAVICSYVVRLLILFSLLWFVSPTELSEFSPNVSVH